MQSIDHKILYRISYLLLILLAALSFNVYSQEFKGLQTIISNSDYEKVIEAEKYRKDADKLIQEANDLYLQTFEVQADYSIDEKTIDKKVALLEKKASALQSDAAKSYEKGNKIIYDINANYIKKFWDEFEGDKSNYVNEQLIEEQAKDFYYQASTLRRDASKTSDISQKNSLLNEAYNYENKSLFKQINALASYYSASPVTSQEPMITAAEEYGYPSTYQDSMPYSEEVVYSPETDYMYTPTEPVITPSYGVTDEIVIESPAGSSYTYQDKSVEPSTYITTPITPTTSSISEDVQVNQDIIAKYQQYSNDSTIPDPVIINRDGISTMDGFNPDEIHSNWASYQGMKVESLDQDQYAEGSQESYEENLSDEQSKGMQQTSNKEDMYDAGATAQGYTTTEEQIITVIEKDISTYHIPTDENVIYRVQVAANKAQLPQKALMKVYYGNKRVEMINEDGWYKYSIGDFDTYSDADEFRKSCGVQNAFVVAYRKGTRFLTKDELAVTTKDSYEETPSYQYGNVHVSEGFVFNVQLAASRNELSREQLSRIYAGDCALQLVIEDNWYKYQITGFRLYSDALKVKNQTGVKGAFISAYQNGNKISIRDAIDEIKVLEQEILTRGRRGIVREIDFYTQIIASKVLLNESEIQRFYSGSYDLILVIEDDLYKYQINSGTDYNEAVSIKNSCGVPKAFVTAYKRGKIIPLFIGITESGY